MKTFYWQLIALIVNAIGMMLCALKGNTDFVLVNGFLLIVNTVFIVNSAE